MSVSSPSVFISMYTFCVLDTSRWIVFTLNTITKTMLFVTYSAQILVYVIFQERLKRHKPVWWQRTKNVWAIWRQYCGFCDFAFFPPLIFFFFDPAFSFNTLLFDNGHNNQKWVVRTCWQLFNLDFGLMSPIYWFRFRFIRLLVQESSKY